MRYVAAYLLAVLGGNANPSGDDIKSILGSVGIEANNDCLNKVIGELNGKNVNQVISAGLFKLASVPAGGGAVAAPKAAAAVEIEAPAAVEEKEEMKVVSDESDDDMGFGLFD